MTSSGKIQFPGAGCVVEFMQGNAPMLALVLEDQAGRLRLYTQGKKEVKLAQGRLLPWAGPQASATLSRADADALLNQHRLAREGLTEEIALEELWELAEGEVENASAAWFAGLVWEKPTIDQEAAMARALLADKARFRFNPPDFEIFSRETVEIRTREMESARLREAVAAHGSAFFHSLWEYNRKNQAASPAPPAMDDAELAGLLRELLMNRIAEPESTTSDSLWKMLVKGLPQEPLLPLLLAQAWGIVPEHYNYHLDRAGYERGSAWAGEFAETRQTLLEETRATAQTLPETDPGLAYVSVDPATTDDRDDAFFVEKRPDGSFFASVAVACPALCWPFGSAFDKTVLRRASSLYLPEGTEHMLPPDSGFQEFSLDAGLPRPAFIMDIVLDSRGEVKGFSPRLARLVMHANLSLEQCEAALGAVEAPPPQATPAPDTGPQTLAVLRSALDLARKLQEQRIARGAVIIDRPDPEVELREENGCAAVSIRTADPAELAHFVVGELMILANSALGDWAVERDIPLLFRTQDLPLPREFAGVWTAPQDIARIVRSLAPAHLEIQPRRHAGLGVSCYATATSPLRRYTDLLNQGQVAAFLRTGAPRFTAEELQAMLPLLLARVEAVAQVQRFRPRYWKLVFFRQQGDKEWWDGVVTEENDAFVTVALPWAQIFARGRRKLFDERTAPGALVTVRIGKVNPLFNEIFILEAMERGERFDGTEENLFPGD